MQQYLAHLGRRMKQLRTDARLTQTELGVKLGVEQSYVAAIEGAKRNKQPTLSFLLAVSEYFGVGLDDLLGIAPPVPSAMDALSPEVRAPVEELVRQLSRKQRGDRWNALSNTVAAVGGNAAVDRASRELGVSLTPDSEAELIPN
jgi:transcriptional regulator with XRE-family HTH domain